MQQKAVCCVQQLSLQRLSHGHRKKSIRHSQQIRTITRAAGSTFGHSFRVTTFGESHGKGVGCVIDGVPPRLPITKEEIQVFMSDTVGIYHACDMSAKPGP